MESTDLNHSSDDTQIDSWLRANARQAALPDDGFSARVLAALPAQTPVRRSPRRTWLWLSGGAVGCVVAARTGGSASEIATQFATLVTESRAAFAPLADPSLLLATVVTAGSLMVVYWRELTSKLSR
jgi:hypothetical protein